MCKPVTFRPLRATGPGVRRGTARARADSDDRGLPPGADALHAGGRRRHLHGARRALGEKAIPFMQNAPLKIS